MKKSIFSIFFLLLLTSAFAQSKTIYVLKKRLHTAKEPTELIKANFAIGKEYKENGVYLDSAFFYLDKALSLAIKNDDNENKPEIYNQLALIYGIAETWDKAVDYFEKSIPLLLENEKYNELAGVYNNLGTVYFKSNDYKKAEDYFNHSIQTALINNTTSNLADSYIQLAELKLNQNKFYEAQKYIEKIDNDLNSKNSDSIKKHLISSKINLRLGKYALALNQGMLAKKAAIKQNNLDFSLQSSLVIHAIYEKTGNYRKANNALKEVVKLKNTIQEIQRYNEIEKMDLKLQLQAQEKEVEALEQESYYRYLIYVVIGIALILLILLIFRQVKITKMTNEMYNIQKKLISTELEIRQNKNANTMDAARSADSELS